MQLTFAGDLILDEPNPDHWLSGIAPALQEADIAIGHLEVPHTTSIEEMAGDVPAPAAPPEHLGALARAGFDALSLAGNHMADRGPKGIEDTIRTLDALKIAHAGAGSNLAEARRPAYLEADGRTAALLSYNCVGPTQSWATQDGPGPDRETDPERQPKRDRQQVASDDSQARPPIDAQRVVRHERATCNRCE